MKQSPEISDLTRQLAEAQAEIERLNGQLEARDQQCSELLDETVTCSCGYDSPDDVCLKHFPLFKKLKAELAALKGEMVKPLEWRKLTDNLYCAEAIEEMVTVYQQGSRWICEYGIGTSYSYETCDEAMAAAQAHYTALILSALTTAPGWRPIETAPSLERVIVAGWQPRSGNVAGYWWYHEDFTDENGAPMDHPDATLFVALSDALPTFPLPPEENGG